MIEKLKGLVYGAAIGDALGAHVEFLSLEQIKEEYGPSGIQDLREHAIWTDDTQMTLALTRAVLRTKDQDVESIMKEIAKEFILWMDDPGLSPGMTCMNAVYQLKQGVSWRESGKNNSKGCGTAMRVSHLGYVYRDEPDKLKQVAALSSRITHGHPAAEAGSIAAAFLVKLALDAIPLGHFLVNLRPIVQEISPDFDKQMELLKKVIEEDLSVEQGLAKLGNGWIAEEAVAMALYAVIKNPNDFVQTVRSAVNISGDSDSVGTIAGGISGALLGIDAIPESWVEKLAQKGILEGIVLDLEKT